MSTKIKLIIVTSILLLFICLISWVKGQKETTQDKIEIWSKEYYIQEKENALLEIDKLKKDYAEHEQKMIKAHDEAERLRLYIKEVDKEIYWTYWKPWVEKVMDKICELSPTSPMCWNYEMLNILMEIAEERDVDYKLLIWIMYAESHIWVNFNQENCRQTNNWAGLKARKYDDWIISEKFDKQYETLDKDLSGCWLYYFEDIETFFESLSNTIWIWYKWCNEDVYCIMKSYVGHESGAWVRNVYLFKSL